MGKLVASEILKAVAEDKIFISDFSEEHLNPNSYNLSLGPQILVYSPDRGSGSFYKPLVWGEDNPPDSVLQMDPGGYLIRPGWFYLGSTLEITRTNHYIPILDGRSTTGRTSLHIHATAGFGDIGYEGPWTLEIYSIVPVIVKPYDRICQVSFDTPEGVVDRLYRGKYQNPQGPVYAKKV